MTNTKHVAFQVSLKRDNGWWKLLTETPVHNMWAGNAAR